MTSFANIYPAKEPLGLELADNIVRSKGKLRMDFQLTFFGELDSFESNSNIKITSTVVSILIAT